MKIAREATNNQQNKYNSVKRAHAERTIFIHEDTY